MHPKISLSPHIGAATSEAQERIGKELAEKLKLQGADIILKEIFEQFREN